MSSVLGRGSFCINSWNNAMWHLIRRSKHEVLWSFLYFTEPSGPPPADDMAPQIFTCYGNFTMDLKQVGVCASFQLWELDIQVKSNTGLIWKYDFQLSNGQVPFQVSPDNMTLLSDEEAAHCMPGHMCVWWLLTLWLKVHLWILVKLMTDLSISNLSRLQLS